MTYECHVLTHIRTILPRCSVETNRNEYSLLADLCILLLSHTFLPMQGNKACLHVVWNTRPPLYKLRSKHPQALVPSPPNHREPNYIASTDLHTHNHAYRYHTHVSRPPLIHHRPPSAPDIRKRRLDSLLQRERLHG